MILFVFRKNIFSVVGKYGNTNSKSLWSLSLKAFDLYSNTIEGLRKGISEFDLSINFDKLTTRML